MNVKFWYNFPKKRNSTKVPTESADLEATAVVLKESCSFYNPTLIMANDGVREVRYAEMVGRYYYVTDVRAVNGLFEVDMIQDNLATHKSEIGDYTGYIVRGSAIPANAKVVMTDPLNPPTSATAVDWNFTSVSIFNSTGCYVLGVVGAPPSQNAAAGPNGVARYFALSAAQITQLAIALNDQNVLSQLVLEFTTPLQSIISCKWIPISASSLTTVTERIKIGSWDSGMNGLLITDRFLENSSTACQYPSLSAPWSYGGYLNKSPFVTGTIYLPFVGQVSVDWDINGESTISWRYNVDVFTGDVLYTLTSTNGWTTHYSGNVSTTIPVTSQTYSPLGFMGGVISTIGGVASGNYGQAAGSAVEAIKSLMVSGQINGSLSSGLGVFGGLDVLFILYLRRPCHAAEDNKNVEGVPFEMVGKVSSYPGYLLMRNASLTISDFEPAVSEINGYLNSGFFYE